MKYCAKCGSELVTGDLFCRGCGAQIQQTNNVVNNNVGVQQPVVNNQQVNQPVVQQVVQPVSQPVTINQGNTDEELMKAYIGKKADKIMKQKKGAFSLWTFLEGPFYFIYRKMYLLGLILIVGSLFISEKIAWGLNFILPFLFYSLYLNHVKSKVNKIKNEFPNKSLEELKSICSKQGGTNALAEAIVFAIVIAIEVAVNGL